MINFYFSWKHSNGFLLPKTLQGLLITHEIKAEILSMDSKALQCLAPAYLFSLILNSPPACCKWASRVFCYHTTPLPPHRAFVQIVSSFRKPFPLCFISFSSFRSQLSHYFFEPCNALSILFSKTSMMQNCAREHPLCKYSLSDTYQSAIFRNYNRRWYFLIAFLFSECLVNIS